jgi:hypothetical protein
MHIMGRSYVQGACFITCNALQIHNTTCNKLNQTLVWIIINALLLKDSSQQYDII